LGTHPCEGMGNRTPLPFLFAHVRREGNSYQNLFFLHVSFSSHIREELV